MKYIKVLLLVGLVVLVSNVVDARTLSLGARGDDVAQLQTWLVNNGYPIPLIESGRASKGYFGTQTQDAVKMYQEGNEQNPTGVIDSTSYGNTSVKFGSVTGPDTYFPYVANNNSRVWTVRQTFNSATTTPCSMRAPAATTTLAFAGWQITTGTSTAATIDLGTSTTAYSTTTNLVAAKSIAASAQGYAYWRPAGGSTDNAKMSPSEWVVVKTAGAGLSGYTYKGTCTAVFQEF